MRITRFRATRAHGHLNLDVQFNPQLTFLTGINGSGKTTVVRGIVALLAPSFRELASLDYNLLEVTFEHQGDAVSVSATRTEDDFTINTSGHGSVTVSVFKAHEYDVPTRFAERQADFYREQHALLSKTPALDFITTIPTPMFLDLERRGGTPIRRPRFVHHPLERGGPIQGSLGEGLREAQEIAEDANRAYMARRQELTDELRKGLILMAFALERESETPSRLPRSPSE